MLWPQTYVGENGELKDEHSIQDMTRFFEILHESTSFEKLDVPMMIILSDDSEIEYGFSEEGWLAASFGSRFPPAQQATQNWKC